MIYQKNIDIPYEIENKNTFMSLASLVNTKWNGKYDLKKSKPGTKCSFDKCHLISLSFVAISKANKIKWQPLYCRAVHGQRIVMPTDTSNE